MCKIGTNESKKSEIKLYGPALNAMNSQNYEMGGREMEEEWVTRRTESDQTAQQQTY